MSAAALAYLLNEDELDALEKIDLASAAVLTLINGKPGAWTPAELGVMQHFSELRNVLLASAARRWCDEQADRQGEHEHDWSRVPGSPVLTSNPPQFHFSCPCGETKIGFAQMDGS